MACTNSAEQGMFLLAQPNPFSEIRNLSVHFARFETEYFYDGLFDYYAIEQPEAITRSVEKRRSEYLAGRILAKSCLHEFGYHDTQIKSDSKRCPIWPLDLVGSISHTGLDVISVVGSRNHFAGMGVDIELVVNEDTMHDIKDTVSSQLERLRLYQFKLNSQKSFTLLFSAKEAIFKALYPQVLAYFDFTAVELIQCDHAQQQLVFKVKQNLCESARKGDYIAVHYCCDDFKVVTLCLLI